MFSYDMDPYSSQFDVPILLSFSIDNNWVLDYKVSKTEVLLIPEFCGYNMESAKSYLYFISNLSIHYLTS